MKNYAVELWRGDLRNSAIQGRICDNCLTFYPFNFNNVRDVTDPRQPKQQDCSSGDTSHVSQTLLLTQTLTSNLTPYFLIKTLKNQKNQKKPNPKNLEKGAPSSRPFFFLIKALWPF